ncbi:MAG: four helix bundle protein [Candidatus Saganbacteria bacterium]|nr:four helix bundle protein [Candidatus Saganbacteria bacterium]
MGNKIERKKFDIKDRTFDFSLRIIKLVMAFPKSTAGFKLGEQLMAAGTSIGANVEEADDAHSKKDFIYKMGIARREARETTYWLRIVKEVGLLENEVNKKEIDDLLRESLELRNILSSILTKASAQLDN